MRSRCRLRLAGEKIFLPGRMAAFVPVNLPVVAGMLLSGPGPTQLVWQWVNQSVNAVSLLHQSQLCFNG